MNNGDIQQALEHLAELLIQIPEDLGLIPSEIDKIKKETFNKKNAAAEKEDDCMICLDELETG